MNDIASFLYAAFFAILGFALGWLVKHFSSKRSERAASNLALASAAPPAVYRVDQLQISIEFDNQGNGVFVRRESGIEPISDLQELVIPYSFNVTPQGSVASPTLRSLAPNVMATWRPNRQDATRTEGTLLLRGDLRASTSTTGYELTQQFTRAFFMTREETMEAYQDSAMKMEYLGIAAYVPTRLLDFRVVFPDSHHQLSEGPSAIAFIGETEFQNETETRRIKDYLKVESGTARLQLENPRRGVRYAIAWLAPSRAK